MVVLLVGADRLGRMDRRLKEMGFNRIEHFSGRKRRGYEVTVSPATQLIIVFVDFVSHNLVEDVKKKAKKSEIPLLFARRSLSSLEESIKGTGRGGIMQPIGA